MLGITPNSVKPLELHGRKTISAPMAPPSFDVIVVGAGPAGLTAATQAARAGLKALCLDKLAPGGALINLTALHDYTERADGPQIASQLTDEATARGRSRRPRANVTPAARS